MENTERMVLVGNELIWQYNVDKKHFASPSDMIGVSRHWIISDQKPLQPGIVTLKAEPEGA